MELNEIRKLFTCHGFADMAEIEILDAGKGYAKCRMPIKEKHLNGVKEVMGGALFTLADYTCAVASNIDSPLSITANGSIDFLTTSKGDTLYATAKTVKEGSTLCFYDVDITDEEDRLVARVHFTNMRISKDRLENHT